jgi:hypothetical protein
MRVLIAALIVINPNPMAGPDNDWAPLMREYEVCAETATSYFGYAVCTTGAHERALHPRYKA